jgi:hypothetical protein
MKGRLWILCWRCADGRRGALQLSRLTRPSLEEAAVLLRRDLRLERLDSDAAASPACSTMAWLKAQGYEWHVQEAT